MSRERLTWKRGGALGIGDRQVGLEADLGEDIIREGDLIGNVVEVSPLAGGDLHDLRGKDGKIRGFVRRLGRVVGYEVEIRGKTFYGSSKDFFTDREMLEDIQPPTPTSVALQEGLSHWSRSRTYWGERTDGLEALCFQLASLTPKALPVCTDAGWQFWVPEPQPDRWTVVDCRAVSHEPYWSLSVMVYPVNGMALPAVAEPHLIPDHWARTFSWSQYIARQMVEQHGFPWGKAAQALGARARRTVSFLRPQFDQTLRRVLEEKRDMTGHAPAFPPGSYSVAFSSIRLKAGTIGLVEPPTDRRAYTVISISPAAVKDPKYLSQVILHEALHMAVSSNGGEPHNDEFNQLAERTGLKEEHRD